MCLIQGEPRGRGLPPLPLLFPACALAGLHVVYGHTLRNTFKTLCKCKTTSMVLFLAHAPSFAQCHPSPWTGKKEFPHDEPVFVQQARAMRNRKA
ncbi:hypothetical protein QBC44DRAFT_328937 [Cladorrhinum sp. PSN332]|nr:hypothetical protein QBC44DRAFT_328937 [Cladorrhinum sp. PSN332]